MEKANLCTKLRDLCFNDFYWCFVVLLFITVKYFGRCSNEKQSMKSARLMRLWYSPKVLMDSNRNMTSSSLSSPVHFLTLLQLLVILCMFNQMCRIPEKKQKTRLWGHLITSTRQQSPSKITLLCVWLDLVQTEVIRPHPTEACD